MEKQFLADDTIRMKFSINSARHGLLEQVGKCMARFGVYGVKEKASKKQINFIFEGLIRKLILCTVALSNELKQEGLTVTLHDVQKILMQEIKFEILTKKTASEIRSDQSSNNEDKIEQVKEDNSTPYRFDFFLFYKNHSDSKHDFLYKFVNNHSNDILGKNLSELSMKTSSEPNPKDKEPEIQPNKLENLQENVSFLKEQLKVKDEQLKVKDEQLKAKDEQLKTICEQLNEQLKAKDEQLKTILEQLKAKDEQLKDQLKIMLAKKE